MENLGACLSTTPEIDRRVEEMTQFLYSPSSNTNSSTSASEEWPFPPNSNSNCSLELSQNMIPEGFSDFQSNIFAEEQIYFQENEQDQTQISYPTPPRDNEEGFKNLLTNGHWNDQLEIVVQPQAFYRGRYRSETGRSDRPWRLIQGDSEEGLAAYPIVKIPSWCEPDQQLYIRVTLVTVTHDQIPYHCIHPYPIDTPDENVFLDTHENSIYFPLTDNDIQTREKSFRIRIIKLKFCELIKCKPMHIFDQDKVKYYNTAVETPHEPKKLTEMYSLTQSQFVFTLAKRTEYNSCPTVMFHATVKSRIISEENSISQNRSYEPIHEESNDSIECIPQQGNWEGGETMVIIMPRPINTTPTICFNFLSHGLVTIKEITLIKPKTIRFKIPPCLYPIEKDRVKIYINIQRDEGYYVPIEFEYIAPMREILANRRREWEVEMMSKRFRSNSFSDDQFDTAKDIVEQMNQLSIKKQSNALEKDGNLKKYFNKLKQALNIFIRTNNPSQLFRRTRVLITTELTDAQLLHDAIEHGQSQTVIGLIEQLIDMRPASVLLDEKNESGQTPLLVAAKFNDENILECILRKQINYANEKDNHGNNLFHLLANVKDDQAKETIENLRKILSDEIEMKLLKEKNHDNQTPMDIAKRANNDSCAQILSL